ncbi:hypothetical protein Vafri_21159, partial [Volvox africanus]
PPPPPPPGPGGECTAGSSIGMRGPPPPCCTCAMSIAGGINPPTDARPPAIGPTWWPMWGTTPACCAKLCTAAIAPLSSIPRSRPIYSLSKRRSIFSLVESSSFL